MRTVFGAGAAIGPFIAGIVMSLIGNWALFGWFAVVFAALVGFAVYRLRVGRSLPPEEQSHFVPVYATTQEALEMAEAGAYEEPPAADNEPPAAAR